MIFNITGKQLCTSIAMYRSSNAEWMSSTDAISTTGVGGFPIGAMVIMMMTELPEEGMSHSLHQGDPRSVIVSEHLVEEVEQHAMLWALLFYVSLMAKYKYKLMF